MRLPRIRFLTTGGTIAGRGGKPEQMTGYRAGVLGTGELLAMVPGLEKIADVSGEEVTRIDSKDLKSSLWLELASRINGLLGRDDVDGIVMTHGTDTMEETACFLHWTVKSGKPVVMTGAMRPSTAVSADGPLNLLNSFQAAVNPDAKGILFVMNSRIYQGRYLTKAHTLNADAFQAPDVGPVGCIAGEKSYYHNIPKLLKEGKHFDVSGVKKFPRVDIICTHCDEDGVLIDAAAAAGAKGIIYAGSGMGSIHEGAEPALRAAVKKGITVVRSTRTGAGMVLDGPPEWQEAGFLKSFGLNPQKARVLLQLALTRTEDPEEIQEIFKEY